jgi:hypothetical protein
LKKAVLEISMPVNCLECKLSNYDDGELSGNESLACGLVEKEIEDYYTRLNVCPLVTKEEYLEKEGKNNEELHKGAVDK